MGMWFSFATEWVIFSQIQEGCHIFSTSQWGGWMVLGGVGWEIMMAVSEELRH